SSTLGAAFVGGGSPSTAACAAYDGVAHIQGLRPWGLALWREAPSTAACAAYDGVTHIQGLRPWRLVLRSLFLSEEALCFNGKYFRKYLHLAKLFCIFVKNDKTRFWLHSSDGCLCRQDVNIYTFREVLES
ncbi:MAG: hypothetical protein K2O33_04460, partial [Muribaculaceae bacterium]|nr:hypothetical protein [Muribaculaceae bacterium]